MNLNELHNELKKDPAFVQAEKKMRFRIDLANAVLYARLSKGWSQTELARRVQTRQANISKIETYQANPTLDLIRRICDVLDIDLEFKIEKVTVEIPQRARVADFYFYPDEINIRIDNNPDNVFYNYKNIETSTNSTVSTGEVK